MPGKAALLLGLLLYGWYHSAATGTPGKEVLALYKRANRLFNAPDPTPRTDSMALAGFQQVIAHLEKDHIVDTTLFQSYLKKGVLLDVQGNYPAARDAYLEALSIHQLNPAWSDSLAYTASIYVGSVYYHLNHFDSANYFLSAAATLSKRFPGSPEQERLYNVWGALYYENGNYLQSSNYFTRALEIVQNRKPFDKISAINFENNIAASYYRLEWYDRSIAIYNRLLKYGKFTSQLHVNMGKAFAAMGNAVAALACFKKVDPNKVPGVYNEIAQVQLQLDQSAATGNALDRFSLLSLKDKKSVNSIDDGINHLYRAKLLSKQLRFYEALVYLQKAIIIFSGSFSNNDIYTNPTGFTGNFASYKLFEALRTKAEIFENWYRSDHRDAYLQATLATYLSTISLLRYIEKSYDTDDARILLKKNSQAVYQGAFLVCLQLHQLHPDGHFLEQAFLIAEKNKASVIASQLTEHQFKKMRGIDPSLFQKERQLKYHIARLNIKSDQIQDQSALGAIAKEKMDVEIELSKLQQEFERNNAYYKLKYDESYPGLQQIQRSIHPDQALISLYATSNMLHTFVITQSLFRYVCIDSLNNLKQRVESWTAALQSTTAGRRFNNQATGDQLYRQLVQPIQAVTKNKNEWIIIPDDFLHFLPFESLPGGDGLPLLTTTTISYHFSSRLIVASAMAERKDEPYSVLSFAPFNSKGMPADAGMYRLPASAAEIAGLPGRQYFDSVATKAQFLQQVNQFPIVHLVTHAVSDNNNSRGSFIAFYPARQMTEEDRLYVDELYGLNMDATRLVILSACETGHGKLISSEGVMSLSRGFAYTGCASIINSLWKSDDAASSAILKQFHHYLQQGFTASKALQQSKLDYIHSNTLYKTPDYWANLVLIGNTDAVVSVKHWPVWPFVIGCLGMAIAGYMVYRLFRATFKFKDLQVQS